MSLTLPCPHQTGTFPSEHSTTVSGQSSFQAEPFFTASHSAIVPSKVTEVREEHPRKAWFPMLVTPSGMVTEVREVQRAKDPPPMLVTLSGMMTEVSEVLPEKA